MDNNYNSGHRNSGYCNSGYCNSGYCNSGDYNSGYYNSGNYNSGYYNPGNYNSGNYNSGNRNSGHFNTTIPDKVRMFDKWLDISPEDVVIPYIYLPLNEWTDSGLVTRTYHEAWAIAWAEASEELRQQFLDLPGFDAAVFKEITGVNVEKEEVQTITIGDTTYEVTPELLESLARLPKVKE